MVSSVRASSAAVVAPAPIAANNAATPSTGNLRTCHPPENVLQMIISRDNQSSIENRSHQPEGCSMRRYHRFAGITALALLAVGPSAGAAVPDPLHADLCLAGVPT